MKRGERCETFTYDKVITQNTPFSQSNDSFLTCSNPKDMCNATGVPCKDLEMKVHTFFILVPCPENSYCSKYGPALVECLCSDDYHGYKCLKKVREE